MRRHATVALLLAFIIASQVLLPGPVPAQRPAQLDPLRFADPLGHFEGAGVPGSLSWTGDGQRLSNPSFETGFAPWLQSQSNTANGSAITLAGPGFQDATSAKLLAYSGNSSALSLASDSTEGLTDVLAGQRMAFNSATRFRIQVMVQTVAGSTTNDRVEASLTLTTSTGNLRTIHYLIGGGPGQASNTAADGYLKVPGYGTTGQWISVDRNMPADAAALFSDAASINSVQSISLTAHAQSLPGPQLVDPHIMFWKPITATSPLWQYGEPVVYDANSNGVYDTGETVIGCGYPNSCSAPPDATPLSTDSRIKFVDTDHNGLWTCSTIVASICTSGEPVAVDNDPTTLSGDGIYDYGEPTINGPPAAAVPIPGTLLERVAQVRTQALFDRVELYTATGGYAWVRNGGFEAGLAGWYSNSSFTSVSSPVHSGSQSARAAVTGGAAEMAQSIDARPLVNASMTLQASAYVSGMTGSLAADYADLWLALDDSQGNSLSLYYYFDIGTGTLPANRTDAVYMKADSFGSTGKWLNISQNLLPTIQAVVASNGLSYTPPYIVQLAVLEISASDSKTTTVLFDDISLGTPEPTGPAPSYFYAQDGVNTTYVYTAASVPQGSFFLDAPLGRTLVNITSPEGTPVSPGQYTISVSSGSRRITILDSASFNHSPLGTWKIFTGSTNAVASVYAEIPSSLARAPAINVGTTVNFVSQSKDPFNQPLQNTPINLTLWNSYTGTQVGSPWAGTTNSQGWWNITGVTLPISGTLPGVYSLQAQVPYTLYPGIRTFQIAVQYTVTLDVTLSGTDVPAGQSITISGTVTRTDTPGPAQNINVTVSYRMAGNSQWTTLAIVKTDSSGKYTYTWTPPEGEYQVMTSTGDITTAPAQTTPVHLLVNSAGLPWLVIIAVAAVAAAAIFLAFIFMRRRRKPSPANLPSLPPILPSGQ